MIDALKSVAVFFWREIALGGALVWAWLMPWFTPEGSATALHWLSAFLVFIAAFANAMRALFRGDPPRPDIGVSR